MILLMNKSAQFAKSARKQPKRSVESVGNTFNHKQSNDRID
jgi:hypothetical protein